MEYKLIIEELSGHATEGKIGKINFNAGDTIKNGDVLFTIEAGKGTVSYKSKYDGTLKSLSISEGQVVKKKEAVGAVEGTMAADAPTEKKSYSFGLAKPKKETLEPDVAIVGGGPGGYVAAIRSAQLGLDVVLIEENRMGGTCLNRGCIPTKALAHSVSVFNNIKNAEQYGFAVEGVTASVDKIIARKNEVVDTLVGGIEHLMEVNGVKVISGKAVVADDGILTVNTKKLDATVNYKNLIVATGSVPGSIPIEGRDLDGVMTSRDLLDMTEIPESITIIGGGVIGMEFAFILNDLGSKVNVVEFMPEILPLLDDDVVEVIKASATEKGIQVHVNSAASSIKKTIDGKMIIEISKNDGQSYITSEKVLMAVGRRANIKALNLEKLGVELNERGNGINVDGHMRTSNPKVYAIGDVTNVMQLAHVASHQGLVAAENISGIDKMMDYENVPSAIFTNPEVGSSGMSEKVAKEKGIDYKVGKFPIMANGKALAMGETEGFIKLIYDNTDERVIGGAIVGAHGTDMIATITNLIGSKIDKESASHVIYAHPTMAESMHEAILTLSDKGIHFA